VKILTDLPHTPVGGVGVNFRFIEPEPAGRLLQSFQLSDQGYLADAGAVIRTTSIRRGVDIAGSIVNITLQFLQNAQVRVDLNFHRDVPNAEAARHHLETGILNFQHQAVSLLRTAYQIENIGA
jgi:hypothetical protein